MNDALKAVIFAHGKGICSNSPALVCHSHPLAASATAPARRRNQTAAGRKQNESKFRKIFAEKLEFISFRSMQTRYGRHDDTAVEKIETAWDQYGHTTEWRSKAAPKLLPSCLPRTTQSAALIKGATRFLAIGFCILTTNCGNVPDCGSDAVVKLATRIASDHPDNKLAAHIHEYASIHSSLVKESERKAYEQLNLECSAPHPACNDMQSINRKLNQFWNLAKNGISYDLNTIRMQARNSDTGRLTCQAVMTAELPDWGSAKMNITYTVEKTTKRELYVQIYGFE